MASTSLRRQVDALRHASSGTSSGYIQRKKGRPSLLLTPDQAADVDLSSVRETAVMGLQRLEALDQGFSAFQETLFSKEAETTLRDLQTKESNKRIDESVNSFLALLSPHFSSREAHFCLEYLIRHYKIYQYNVDAVVECCLPWHDTVAFARLVQLLSLKGTRWEFLTPVQKTGSPLPREAIARRCARDYGLLRFLCLSASRVGAAAAAQSSSSGGGGGGSAVSPATAAGRAKLFSFYAAVVVEALASLGSTNEALLRALVPSVVQGLSATRSPEYQVASYMIMSSLCGKGPLSPEVTGAAFKALACKPCQGGLDPPLLCALAVAQSQAGFMSKQSPSGEGKPAASLLPPSAFKKLSGMESLAGSLAGLASKFDATAFVWLLLQSYVHHLPDDDGDHASSLVRLCTYPHWPSHSLPRLVRRLVDRLVKSYLTVAHEGVAHKGDDEVGAEQCRRATAMKAATETVLRVLGQRFPKEVDSAVGKLTRYVAKSKEATAAAAADVLEEGGDDDSDVIDAASREAFREEALSSLLVSTFAGAELAQHLALQSEDQDNSSSGRIHGSLMVAMEHSSGEVRARAVEQLARALSSADAAVNGDEGAPAAATSEDLSAAVLRRLQDEDPQVVLSVTDNEVLLRRVLLRLPHEDLDGADDDDSLSTRAALVASTAASAAVPWLASLSEGRPKHPVASAGRVIGELIRTASKACSALVNCAADDAAVVATRSATLNLYFECLPGPHANARVIAAQAAAVVSSGVSEGDAGVAAKACKKALRAVARSAVDAICGLDGGSPLFQGVGKVLEKTCGDRMEEEVAPKSSKKGKGRVKANEMSVDMLALTKSKGLKAMGNELCDVLASAISKGHGEDILQIVGETAGPGARWLVLEVISRAISLAEPAGSASPDLAASCGRLSALLARLATLEPGLQDRSLPALGDGDASVLASISDLVGYLKTCAPYLARSARPCSVFSGDHVSEKAPIPTGDDGQEEACVASRDVAEQQSPLLGDVLVTVLKASVTTKNSKATDIERREDAVRSAVTAVVLHGYGRRPLPALAAVAISGGSSSWVDRESRRAADDGKVAAARALCVAAAFVRAAAESGLAESASLTNRDLVATFPAALLAITSKDKALRDAGLLLVSVVSAHGDTLCDVLRKGKKSPVPVVKVDVSDFFPAVNGDPATPAPVPCSASLSNVVKLADALWNRNKESALDEVEVTRYLAALLGDGANSSPENGSYSSTRINDKNGPELVRYLVTWGTLLGRRNDVGAARFLGCLRWAKHSLRESGIPLLRHRLDMESVNSHADGAPLLELLLDATLVSSDSDGSTDAWDTKRTPRKSGDAHTGLFSSAEAESLFYRALRASGVSQALSLRALISRGAVVAQEGQGVTQRRGLLRALVEVALAGADWNLVAAAAKALPARPTDISAVIVDVVDSGRVGGSSTSSKATKRRREYSSGTLTATTPQTAWVSTFGGVVELAQALMGPSPSDTSLPVQKSKGKKGVLAAAIPDDPASPNWSGVKSLALARPLFDALPELLAVVRSGVSDKDDGTVAPETVRPVTDVVAAAEYALWLTMDVLAALLQRLSLEPGSEKGRAKRLYDGRLAGEDAERVLSCMKENPSPQTRNSALALLSGMATLFPTAMASRLRALLDAVCAAATSGAGSAVAGGRAALRQTQKAVKSIVPALRANGAAAGVGAHVVVQFFVEALAGAPVHVRHTLFGTLVDSLGDDSLAILSALLLRQSVFSRVSASSNPASEENTSSAVEFVHQTVHCCGAESQVKGLVGLVQACHRLSVDTAKRSRRLSGTPLEGALESFTTSGAGDDDYMSLPLAGELRAASSNSGAAFMTMDLKALMVVSEAESQAGGRAAASVVGSFLEVVLSFVRDHLGSRSLVMSVAAAAEAGDKKKDEEAIQEGFLLLCEELLLLLRTLAACEQGTSSAGVDRSSWAALQSLAYSVLDALQSLLTVPSFVAVTQELLRHQDPHLRRKALQMFTRRLDPASGGSPSLFPGEESLFIDMVPSLRLVATGKSHVVDSDDENVVMGGGRAASDGRGDEESPVNRQTALLSLDVLARVLGRRHQLVFMGVLDDVTEIVAGDVSGDVPDVDEGDGDGSLPLRASAFLLLATLCAILGVRAFPRLPRFFPAMLEALETSIVRPAPKYLAAASSTVARKGERGGERLLWTSALSAVATVAASLPSFLSPYIGRILAIALSPACAGDAAVSPGGGNKQAADRVLSLLSAGVEPRLLIPAVCGAYAGCVDRKSDLGGSCQEVAAAKSVARLLSYVQEIIVGLGKEAASAALPQFTHLLTRALDFRRLHASGSGVEVRASADLVETEATAALVSLVMKLSEAELRPLFLHLCEWKAGVSGDGPQAMLGLLDRRLSFYRVLDGLAAALKSIFTPYFAHVLTDCCDDMEAASQLSMLTDGTELSKRKRGKKDERPRKKRSSLATSTRMELGERDGEDDEDEDISATPELYWRRSAAARLALSALRRCFQSDRSGFVDKARFEVILPSIVSQLECGSDYSSMVDSSNEDSGAVVEVASCRFFADELVGPCLAQLASACGKDALWKALANAVLMRTRSGKVGARVAALVCLRHCFEVVGEEFLALLPECLPFLSELLEDGHPEVEGECRSLIKYIEGVLGESIESYLV